ncbi:MAG: hypothetical protein WAV04_01700 [Candidatus Microsaccharimonas sp.]
MIKIKAPRIRIPRPRKRVVIITIAALLVVTLGVYGFISYTTWRDLDQESKQVASSLKTAANEALGAEKDTISPLAEMKTLVSDFDTHYSDAPCQVSPLINWQMIIPQIKTITNECDQRFLNSLEFIASLKLLIAFIEDEQTTSTLLSNAVEATKEPTDYTAASATWKSVADSADLSDTGAFQSVADKTKEVASGISTAYASLATAVKDEDKTAFDDALRNLDTAYSSTAEIGTLAAGKRQALVTNIAAAYDAL